MRDMMNSPAMRAALDQGSRNPETLRPTFEVARNPELMREQMRLTDRAFTNVEAHPGGFNALSRAHAEVQEPMMNAVARGRGEGAAPATSVENNPFAAMFAQTPPAGGGGAAAQQGTAQASNAGASAPGSGPPPPAAANPWDPASFE